MPPPLMPRCRMTRAATRPASLGSAESQRAGAGRQKLPPRQRTVERLSWWISFANGPVNPRGNARVLPGRLDGTSPGSNPIPARSPLQQIGAGAAVALRGSRRVKSENSRHSGNDDSATRVRGMIRSNWPTCGRAVHGGRGMTSMTGVPDANDLGNLELFRGLSVAELTRVNDLLGRTAFPAGAMILTATQPGEMAYIILDGTLKVSTLQSNGRELMLALLGPGEIVGELALADRSGRSADVTALEAATLVWIDRNSFAQLRRDIPGHHRESAAPPRPPSSPRQRPAPGDGHPRRPWPGGAATPRPRRRPGRAAGRWRRAHSAADHPIGPRRAGGRHPRPRQRGPRRLHPPQTRSPSTPNTASPSTTGRSWRRIWGETG